MSSSKVYKVRGKSGQIYFEGDLDSLRAWLADKRIHSEFEVQQQGLEVLQGERLWALVRERPELGFDPTVERIRNERLRIWLWWWGALSLTLFLIGAGLTAFYIVAPAFESSSRLSRIEESISKRMEDTVAPLVDRIQRVEAELETVSTAFEANKAASEALGSSHGAKLSVLEGTIGVIRSDIATLSDEISKAKSSIDSLAAIQRQHSDAIRGTASLPKAARPEESTSEARELDSISDFLEVSWIPIMGFGRKSLVIRNKTDYYLNVQISPRSSAASAKEFYVMIPPRESYNSGDARVAMNHPSAHTSFRQGERLGISFRNSGRWSNLDQLEVSCP